MLGAEGQNGLVILDAEHPILEGLPVPDSLVICADGHDVAERCLRASMGLRRGGLPAVLLLMPLSVSEASRLVGVCQRLLNTSVIVGSVIGPYAALGTPSAVIRYSGDMDAYKQLFPILRLFGPVTYAGQSPIMAPLLDSTASGVHHASLLALLVGYGMCMRYGLDYGLYAKKVCESMPSLSQGAYRNIWAGLLGPNCFEDVDDDIHAMEMLVYRLKVSGGIGEIAWNENRQNKLNRMIFNYWHVVENWILVNGAHDV